LYKVDFKIRALLEIKRNISYNKRIQQDCKNNLNFYVPNNTALKYLKQILTGEIKVEKSIILVEAFCTMHILFKCIWNICQN
jgi:hypothetical protein